MNRSATIEPTLKSEYFPASTAPSLNLATSYLTADPVLSVPFVAIDLTEPILQKFDVPPISRALQRLTELEHLEANWDSYGSVPPTHGAVEAARDLIVKVAKQLSGARPDEIVPFSIAPVSGGGIQLEWRRGEHSIEIDISADEHYGFLYASGVGNSQTFEELDNVTESDILKRVLLVVQ